MKILVLSSSYPRYPNDYIAPFLHDLFTEIQGKTHEIIILVPQIKGMPKIQEYGNLKVHRIPYTNNINKQVLSDGFLPERLKSNSNRLNLIKYLFNAFRSAIRLHKKKNFNLIHSQWIFPSGFLGLVLKFMINRPLIVTIHGAGIFLMKKYPFLKPFLKLTLKKADLIIFNSNHTKNETLKIYNKLKNKIVLHQGINIDRFQDLKEREFPKNELFKDNLVILSVGRLIERKGFKYLITAMKHVKKAHPNAKLLIIGTGPEENTLKTLAKGLHLQDDVIFLGQVKGKYIPHYFTKSTLFVLPSIIDRNGDTEGLGIVLLEAMAAGIPVIGTDVGGIVDIIDSDQDGFLVPQKNIKELINSINELLTDKALREKYKKNGLHKVIEKFQWSKIANKTIQEYKKLLKLEMKK